MRANWLKELFTKEPVLKDDERKTEMFIQIYYRGTKLKLRGVTSIEEANKFTEYLTNNFPWYNAPFKLES